MRMRQGRPRRLAVVFENQDVLEELVFLQIENAVAKCPEHVFDLFWRQSGQRCIVVIGFHNHFVRADAVHLVEHAFGLAVQIAFDAKGGKLIRDSPNRPARGIFLWWRPAILRTIGLDLGRGLALVSITEGTEAAPHLYCFTGKVSRTLGAVGRDNDPAANNRIFSEFGQVNVSSAPLPPWVTLILR